MVEFDTGSPSVRLVQKCIKDKRNLEVKLLTGELLEGACIWQDTHTICLVQDSQQKLVIWRQAIAYLKPR